MLQNVMSGASANLQALRGNLYPGRGVVAGVDESGAYLIQVCWIMGRSANSRNRVYKQDGRRVFTDLAQPDPDADTALIIYDAMGEIPGYCVASNGDQTNTVLEGLAQGAAMADSLRERDYEPDKPNYTPRITALCAIEGDEPITLSILRRASSSDACRRLYFVYSKAALSGGLGWCLTTYKGDGNPLPAFDGVPYLVPLQGDIHDVCDTFWDVLNEENRIALAVKFIDRQSGDSQVKIANKYG